MKVFVSWLAVLCMVFALQTRGLADECHGDDSAHEICAVACATDEECSESKHPCDSHHGCEDHHGCHCTFHHLPLSNEDHSRAWLVMGSGAEPVRWDRDRLPEEPYLGSEKPPLI